MCAARALNADAVFYRPVLFVRGHAHDTDAASLARK